MEELKISMTPEGEEQARAVMEQMREASSAELTATIDKIPKEMLSDQWKRGGICAACRRKDYCKTQCRANRDYASVRIREYVKRHFGISQIQEHLQSFGGDAE